jgi:hypothetical protein
MEKIVVTQTQMNLLLTAVEYGFRAHEHGKNLQAALAGVNDLYEVKMFRLVREQPTSTP